MNKQLAITMIVMVLVLLVGLSMVNLFKEDRILGEGPVYIKPSELEYVLALAHRIEAGVIVVTSDNVMEQVPSGNIQELIGGNK